jgi:hypothetical protein
MENEKLILFRLDQQDERSEKYRDETKASLGVIEELVTKTNGRVSSLEKWRYTVSGAILALTLIIGWVVTMKAGH